MNSGMFIAVDGFIWAKCVCSQHGKSFHKCTWDGCPSDMEALILMCALLLRHMDVCGKRKLELPCVWGKNILRGQKSGKEKGKKVPSIFHLPSPYCFS